MAEAIAPSPKATTTTATTTTSHKNNNNNNRRATQQQSLFSCVAAAADVAVVVVIVVILSTYCLFHFVVIFASKFAAPTNIHTSVCVCADLHVCACAYVYVGEHPVGTCRVLGAAICVAENLGNRIKI